VKVVQLDRAFHNVGERHWYSRIARIRMMNVTVLAILPYLRIECIRYSKGSAAKQQWIDDSVLPPPPGSRAA